MCSKHTKERPQPVLSHGLSHPPKHYHVQRCRTRAVIECPFVEEELRVASLALDQHVPRTRPRGDLEVEIIPGAARRLLLLLHQAPLRVPRGTVKFHVASEEVVLAGNAAVELDRPVVCVDSVHVEGRILGVHDYVGRVADRGVEDIVGEAWHRRRQIKGESSAHGFNQHVIGDVAAVVWKPAVVRKSVDAWAGRAD